MKKGNIPVTSSGVNNPFESAASQKRPLILDGATGSYLHNTGFRPDPLLWFSHLNKINPAAVVKVHQAYIKAGADIITTNTFRTNSSFVNKQSRFTQKELVKAAVANAFDASKSGERILIAGSNPPAEDCYQEERKISRAELILNHHGHIQMLAENGCNFILNETQSHFDEIKIICEFCAANKIQFILSILFTEGFKLLSGESVNEVIKYVRDYNPLAIGFNCISIPLFKAFLDKNVIDFRWGFYLNYGIGNLTDYMINNVLAPGAEQKVLEESIVKNVSFIGGCCGSGPGHIMYIRKIIYGNNNT